MHYYLVPALSLSLYTYQSLTVLVCYLILYIDTKATVFSGVLIFISYFSGFSFVDSDFVAKIFYLKSML